MAIRDLTSQRLYVDAPLGEGLAVTCSEPQANYLRNVLRMRDGDGLLVFNGRDGEWRARLSHVGKRGAALVVGVRERAQHGGPDIHYVFAPIKRARIDTLVEKATEMGVARIVPVITRHTVAERVNLERLRAHIVEAAEQCGILRLPQLDDPVAFDRLIQEWSPSRRLIFCDESASVADPIEALRTAFPGLATAGSRTAAPPSVAVLVGPEGGFSADERQALLAHPFTLAISLGPRIMRADTAAIAALALVNAVLGDWCDTRQHV